MRSSVHTYRNMRSESETHDIARSAYVRTWYDTFRTVQAALQTAAAVVSTATGW